MPRVTARIGATLAAGGPTRRGLDVPDGGTVADAVAVLEGQLGMPAGSLGSAAVSVSGAIVGHDHPLLGGEELAVVVPVAGG
jgi:sulfur carrier protein ThiS